MVPHPSGLKQEDYIYTLDWDVNVVTLFAEVLADQARMGNFHPACNNRHAIQTAQYMLSKFFNKSFDLKECVKQVRLLRKRHVTFSTILKRDDAAWAMENNEMAYTDSSWENIVSQDPFAWAYAEFGDPHWDDLKVIFGNPHEHLASNSESAVNEQKIIVLDDNVRQPRVPSYTPLDEVIVISSDNSGSLSSSFMKDMSVGGNDSDNEDSIRSPSLKTEMSSSNNAATSKGKGTMFGENVCMSLYGASYVSSSANPSPNGKK